MKKKILIVDDDKDLRAILKMMVESEGYTCMQASNGEYALNILNDNSDFVAVITDMVMPVMGGRELVRILREEEKFKSLVILVVSAVETLETVRDLMDLGASGFLPKPFSKDQIAKFLEREIK